MPDYSQQHAGMLFQTKLNFKVGRSEAERVVNFKRLFKITVRPEFLQTPSIFVKTIYCIAMEFCKEFYIFHELKILCQISLQTIWVFTLYLIYYWNILIKCLRNMRSYSTSRQSYVTVYAEAGVIFKKLQLLFE